MRKEQMFSYRRICTVNRNRCWVAFIRNNTYEPTTYDLLVYNYKTNEFVNKKYGLTIDRAMTGMLIYMTDDFSSAYTIEQIID